MKSKPNRGGWSLPITWILLVIGLTIFLVVRLGWWWIGIPVVLYFGTGIVAIIVNGKKDAEKEKLLKLLQLPLYGLYHMHSIEQSKTGGYMYDIVPEFTDQYAPEQRRNIIKAMRMALSDRDIDLSGMLVDVPFSNAEIRLHLKETLKRLKNPAR